MEERGAVEPGTGGRAAREDETLRTAKKKTQKGKQCKTQILFSGERWLWNITHEGATITEPQRQVLEGLCTCREESRSCTGLCLIAADWFPARGLVLET